MVRLLITLLFILGSICAQGKEDLCEVVALQYPEDGAVSYRVMQDFYWSRMGADVIFDFKIDKWNEIISEFEPYLSYQALPENGRLTNSLLLPENRFHPPWFLNTLSQVEIGGEQFIRAPVCDPGYTYRWSVRISGSGEECWSSRTIEIAMDPNNRLGVNTHLTMPEEWWPDLGYSAPSQSEIQAFSSDLNQLAVPYLFEGGLQAWGRDAFRDQDGRSRPVFWESDQLLAGLNTSTPTIISQNMFQPFRVRTGTGGVLELPILGTDFFTMFDPSGADAVYLDPVDYSVLPQYNFSRHDPRTRPVYLFDVTINSKSLSWHDLWDYWEQIYCAYHTWRVDPDDPVKRQAILDRMAEYQNHATQFLMTPRTSIQDAFAAYVQESVSRYKDRVSIWHFGNEPNGGWHIDPRLYARQLAFFAEMVRSVDPEARIMAATIFPGNQAAVNGEIFHDGMPDFWWIDQFVAELTLMRTQGTITFLPFDVAGLNFYFIREDSSGRNMDDGLGRSLHWGSMERGCTVDHTPCPGLEAQECQFELFAVFYAKWRDALDQLADIFLNPDTIPIIIKETASFSQSQQVTEEHLPRGLSFLFELGHIDDTVPTSMRAYDLSEEKRLKNVRAESRIEAACWFHYHLSSNTFLIDQLFFPQQAVHTALWNAIYALNEACAPRDADAGPDRKSLCGMGVALGSPPISQQQYSWLPTLGLDNPMSAEPWATPTATTTYTLTQANPCGEWVQDVVIVYAIPPLEPGFYPMWRLELGLTPEFDVDDSGRIDISDYVSFVNSGANCQ